MKRPVPEEAVNRLDLYLGQTYHALNSGKGGFAEQAFRSLAGADADFKKEAEAKLKTITEGMRKRDHISRVHHDILTRVLND